MRTFIIFFAILLGSLHTAHTLEETIIFDGAATKLAKKCTWKETSLLYDAKTSLSNETTSLLASIGARDTYLSVRQHNHPTNFLALLGTVGIENTLDQWKVKWIVDGAFQIPSFNPFQSSRYASNLFCTYSYNCNLSFDFGAGMQWGLHSTTAYPILGLKYTISNWTLDYFLPFDMYASYKINETCSVGAFIANTLNRSYRTQKAYGRKDAIINFIAQFAGVFWKYNFSEKTKLVATVGSNIHSKLSVGNKTNHHVKTISHSGKGLWTTLGLEYGL